MASSVAVLGAQSRSLEIETLSSITALPPHVIARMEDPIAVARTPDGNYLILDRRAHTVFRSDPSGRDVRRLMEIGHEPGHLLSPSSLAIDPRGVFFAVADAPNGLQRIQYFGMSGSYVGGFFLPIAKAPGTPMNELAAPSAIGFTGSTFLVNEPSWGSLALEMDLTGAVLRHIGELRPTGYERDAALHQALNVGLPIPDPAGGFYFVFQTGVPMFRKYDAKGQLVFERHVEGRELDPLIQSLPNRWLARPDDRRPLPLALVRTATADAGGHLWIALRSLATYVYDPRGEKQRVVRFLGARTLDPSSLFFTPEGRLVVGPEGYEFDVR